MAESIIKFENKEGTEVTVAFDDVKKYLCPLATEAEIIIFLQVCKMRRLNPFTGEIYLIKYVAGQKAGTVVNYHTFLQRAKGNPNYRGFKSGIIVLNKEGEIERREGAFYLTTETLLGGWCRVRMEGFEVPMVEISLIEYQQYKSDGQLNRFWKKMAGTMIKKTAEGQGHRLANPEDLAGLMLQEELRGEEEVIDIKKEKDPSEKKGEWKDVSPEVQVVKEDLEVKEEIKAKEEIKLEEGSIIDLDLEKDEQLPISEAKDEQLPAPAAPEERDEQPSETTAKEMWDSMKGEALPERAEDSPSKPPKEKKKVNAPKDLPDIIKIHSLREKAGIERVDFFFNLSAKLGRQITSTKDLIEEEKKEVIKELVEIVNKKMKKGEGK